MFKRFTFQWPSQAKLERAVISGFIIIVLAGLFCQAIPFNSLLRTALNDRFSRRMLWSILWQPWNMFSPNPLATDTYLEAKITFENGQRRVWKFPQVNKMSFTERYFKERYRKWANEYVRDDSNSRLWPDVARYIARQHHHASNPPRVVKLIRYWRDIPPPPDPEQSTPPSRSRWQHFTFFTYQLAPGDLR